MNALSVYERLPYFLQTAALNYYAAKIHRARYGSKFYRLLDSLLETQWYSADQIREFQGERLRTIVTYAYDNVAYYRKRMMQLGLTPADIADVSDIGKLPILEKDDVRANYAALLSATSSAKQLGKGSTSGTTGSPLTVAWDLNTQQYNNAVDWRQKCWAGVQYGERIAQILGRPIVALSRNRPPFWQTDFIHKQLWLSAFHMKPQNLHHYFEKIRAFRPVAIEGYPSTVYELAKFIDETAGGYPVKAVFTSSEPLYPHQRELIEKCFQTRVFDFYGHAERTVFSTQCEAHHGQHVNFEYGILELLDDAGAPQNDGGVGTMVGTSLCNFGMPLIRYRIGDQTRFITQPCSCGRQMQRMECVESKSEDRIVRPDGTVISASVLTHPFKPITAIEKSQIIQHGARAIEIKIVRRKSYTTQDETRLLSEFRKRVGAEFNVEVAYVEDIPKTKNGKYRWVINLHAKSSTSADAGAGGSAA
jgi:phenylacetate-CoA ligase